MDDRLAAWRKAQGHDFPDQMDQPVTIGPYYSDSWRRDPKHVLFGLARYRFVAKMLKGAESVAEIGAGDGWASQIVAQEVYRLQLYDLSPLNVNVSQYDVMKGSLSVSHYDAIYAIDIFEHVVDGDTFFRNLCKSLHDHGKLVVGTPSLESQVYASEPSRKLHINCVSGETLRGLALKYFRHVIIAAQNDEVVHFGFLPMAHYLWAICAEPIR